VRYEIVNPESLGAPSGWNNGLLAPSGNRVLFVAGQAATEADGTIRSTGFVDQFSRVLQKILKVVEEAGGGPQDIGRLTVYVTDLATYRASRRPLGEAWKRLMGRHYPAMTLVEVSGLLDDGALVEIEATAMLD
jgi:enamine deaminase RidA (YjgF/YER057c/UK114 family)